MGFPLEEARSLALTLWGAGLLERERRNTWRVTGTLTVWEAFPAALDTSAGQMINAQELWERTGLGEASFIII